MPSSAIRDTPGPTIRSLLPRHGARNPAGNNALPKYFYCCRDHRDLHSFPTRRSSDLGANVSRRHDARDSAKALSGCGRPVSGSAAQGASGPARGRTSMASSFHGWRHGAHHVRRAGVSPNDRRARRLPDTHEPAGDFSKRGISSERQQLRSSMRFAWICLFAMAPPMRAAGPLQLSLKRAVEIATSPEGNTRIQLSGEALKQAESRAAQARAALLPDLEAAFSEQNLTRNLAAQGISITVPIPGFDFPTFVGPFSTMDARVTGSQNVLDFSSIRRFQASKVGIAAAKSDVSGSAEQVAAQVARAYLAAVKADADVEVAQANVTLSEAVLKQSENQKAAGTGTGIDITRARVQLANDRQKMLVAQNQRRSAQLQLLRAMGVRLDTELELTDKLAYVNDYATT